MRPVVPALMNESGIARGNRIGGAGQVPSRERQDHVRGRLRAPQQGHGVLGGLRSPGLGAYPERSRCLAPVLPRGDVFARYRGPGYTPADTTAINQVASK